MSILHYFPYAKARLKQESSLSFIERAVAAGYHDIVIAAPTGTGKTGIGASVCYWSRDLEIDGVPKGYYLTSQKLLQDQITADFDHMTVRSNASIKSASEYRCGTHSNCAVSGKHCRNSDCPYRKARDLWMSATLAVTNYSYFFTSAEHTDNIVKARVLVADECHNLEREITRHVDLVVSEDLFDKWAPSLFEVPKLNNLNEFVAWIESTYLPEIRERLVTLVQLAEESDGAATDAAELDRHVHKTENAIGLIRSNPSEWVFWSEKSQYGRSRYIARPIDASSFFKGMIQDKASIRIYLSAYPGERGVFCRSLGLDENSVAWASYGSTFDVGNRPIISLRCGSMSMRNVDASAPRLKAAVLRILGMHKDQKGIIHCHSYKMVELIRSSIAGTEHECRILTHKGADERNEVFEHHRTTSDPTVIITPSMFEGFDFKDDLARWQIIAKVPYPHLGDAQVAAKKERDEEWYIQQAVSSIVQASGRIVRSDDDWGVTYILDSDFQQVYNRYEYMFPSWWKRALVLR